MSDKFAVIVVGDGVDTTFPLLSYKRWKFSAGETQIRLTKHTVDSLVSLDTLFIYVASSKIERVLEAGNIASAAKYVNPSVNIALLLPYLPTSRQDRVVYEGDAFSLNDTVAVIGSMQFDDIYTLDIHSFVALKLCSKLRNIPSYSFVDAALQDIIKLNNNRRYVIVSPDAGSHTRLGWLIPMLQAQYPEYSFELGKGSKRRDPETGKIVSIDFDDTDVNGKVCLLVDDICDAGGTFCGLGVHLSKAQSTHLIVTHGIFSKGFDSLKNYFDTIHSTDSIMIDHDECLYRYSALDIMLSKII